MKTPPVVSAEEWNAAREELLVKEKQLTRRATRSRPIAGGCRGSPSTRSTRSTDRTAP